MNRLFVVVSGLPGSGKTLLARRLSPVLNLPLIDKDEILERLFDSKGVGDSRWRRDLSRESDVILQAEAAASQGAILVSFWHLPGMPADSGTPTDWLRELSARIVNVHCVCDPELAARRFCERKRHPGHLDHESSYTKILASIRVIAELEPLAIGHRIDVDTSQEPNIEMLLRDIRESR